jgi:hypothetical protein
MSSHLGQPIDIGQALPVWLRELLALGLTISAAALYAAILGIAILRTVQQGDPEFSSSMVRAASVLSGLVGAVVATGFAQSRREMPIRVAAESPDDPSQEIVWTTGRPVSLLKRNLLGLGQTLGLPVLPIQARFATHDEEADLTEEPAEPQSNKAVMWIALLYFVVYFAVGVASFGLAMWRPVVPDIVSNAGWVWLGTVASAGYSFFALDARS